MGRSHMYLTAIIDWYSRFIVGYELSDTLVFTKKHSAISFALCVLFQASISSFLASSCNIIIAS
jgi:transposase InsO family protein